MKFRYKSFLFAAILLIGFSCATTNRARSSTFNGYNLPANLYQVEANLYCDISEIQNLDWLEYMHWTDKIFGKESKEAKATRPNIPNWARLDSNTSDEKTDYLRQPTTRNYPVIGISQHQARDYSNWRSDRVLEQILITKEIILPNTTQDAHNYFTRNKYYSGNYNGLSPDLSIPYPEFRLPSSAERQRVLKFSDSLRMASKAPRNPNKNYSREYGTIICSEGPQFRALSSTEGLKSKEIIFHLRGNVCEWAAEEGQCYGGSWSTTKEDIIAQDAYSVDVLDNEQTGFRNICQWKYWKAQK